MNRRYLWLHKPIAVFAFALPLAYLPMEASAACTDSKVKSLSSKGMTITTIARTCDMDVDDVRSILEGDDDPPQGSGLAPGTPLAPCGCWGFVAPGYRQPNPTCSSGYAIPSMCAQICPAGGFAWQGVCG